MKLLNRLSRVLLITLIIILPSFFLTSFSNIFDFPKTVLLGTVTLILLTIFAIEVALRGKMELKISSIDLLVTLLVIAVFVSGIVKTQNKMELFLLPGTGTVFLSIYVLYILTKKFFDKDKKVLLSSLAVSGLLVSLISVFSFLGLFAKIPQLPRFMQDISFSPLGGKLPEVIFLLTLIPLNIYLAVSQEGLASKLFWTISGVFTVLSLVLGISAILPGKLTTPALVSFPVSWWVAVETLKVSPLFGIGTGNYLTAFTRFLPIEYNSTAFWAARFATGRSFALTLATEAGLVGISIFLVTVFNIVKTAAKSSKNLFKEFGLVQTAFLSLIILLVLFFLFPANTPLFLLFFVLLAIAFPNNELTINLSATSQKDGNILKSRMPALILGLIILTANGFLLFFGTKAVSAEASYRKALNALTRNDGKATYDGLQKTINQNPNVDRYHATSAQVNLALARAIAAKKDITDQDRSTVSQLIQQAIREAKASVGLNTQRSGNWQVLAAIYAAIMPFAQGADSFAIQSYTQAAALDPVNPNLRISMGGIYYALGRYDEAIEAFKLAVLAKPDLANAHYNLAIAYREKKEFDKAIVEMNSVLSLVSPDSSDYTLAKTELENLEKNRSTKITTGTENLNPPEPVEPSNITPPLELPEDSNPPTQ